MKRVVTLTVTLIVAVLALASFATADVPQMINYQGRLTDSVGNPLDTTVSMTFTIYDDSLGGTIWWTETHTDVQVDSGAFSVNLGAVIPIHDSVFTGSARSSEARYVGIQIGSDPEISPRFRLVTNVYSYRVRSLHGARGGIVYGQLKVDTIFIDSTTRFHTIPFAAFAPPFYEYADAYGNLATSQDYYAPIQLPHDATISAMIGYFFSDSIIDVTMAVEARFLPMGGNSYSDELWTATETVSGYDSLTLTHWDGEWDGTVDNSQWSYVVRVRATKALSAIARLFAVRIEYVIEQPLP